MLRLLLIATSVAVGLGGNVFRDPKTGKWVEVEANSNVPDPRLSSRAGGGGLFGDIFGGGSDDLTDSFSDLPAVTNKRNREVARPPSTEPKRINDHTATLTAVVSSGAHPMAGTVVTRTHKSKGNKFTAEFPVTQFKAAAGGDMRVAHGGGSGGDLFLGKRPPRRAVVGGSGVPQERVHHAPAADKSSHEQMRNHRLGLEQQLMQTEAMSTSTVATSQDAPGDSGIKNKEPEYKPLNKVVYVEHPVELVSQDQTSSSVLPTTVIGTLCRFTGYSPLEGCPEEAPNGCVDRVGCERVCESEGFFSWRCKGAQELKPEMVENKVNDEDKSPADSGEAEKALASKLEAAIANGDYQLLARLIMEQKSAAASTKASNSKRAVQRRNLAQALSALAQVNTPPKTTGLKKAKAEQQQHQQQQQDIVSAPVVNVAPVSAPVVNVAPSVGKGGLGRPANEFLRQPGLVFKGSHTAKAAITPTRHGKKLTDSQKRILGKLGSAKKQH